MMVTDSGVLASDFDSIQSEEIKHVYISADFRTHMFLFVMCLLATRRTFLREFVVIGTTVKSGSV